MTEIVIPLYDLRDGQHHRATVSAVPYVLAPAEGRPTDMRGRRLHDLRISVIDRYNFRCVYCMSKDVFDKDYRFLRYSELPSFEEIERMARLFIGHGVEKIRLTGGKPLLRKDIERLVEKLARLTTAEGKPLDLMLTTNGALPARKAQSLKDAGLGRVTASLDGISDATFCRMSDVDFAVSGVLHGIEITQNAGLVPIRVNMVAKKGDNDDQIMSMARHFRGSGIIVRFTEYIDVDTTNHWDMRPVVPPVEVVKRPSSEFALEPVLVDYGGETAKRWRYVDGAGEVGVISSVTQVFCHDCTRARLPTEGKLYLCPLATEGFGLRVLLRGGATDLGPSNTICMVWQGRVDRYFESRISGGAQPADRRIEMSYIGGWTRRRSIT